MRLLSFLLVLAIFFTLKSNAFAIEDPRSVDNNKFGIHILSPDEISEASKLVNTNGGQWGYVTIPIQIKDRDLTKWQQFMNDSEKHRLIPVIRLATENHYFNSSVWRKPSFEDIVDLSNFLNSLSWPTKNRYIIVFNEVNRSDEWGGELSPEEYADILSFTSDTFKERSQDFFVISAGLDNAAPNEPGKYMNQYDFLSAMHSHNPAVFKKIDGIGSHSYPNPAFSQPPDVLNEKSIASFQFEKETIEEFAEKSLPVFITETGWSKESVGEDKASEYLKEAFSTVWNNEDVVAVTPFLLRAGQGPFTKFSFLKPDGSKTREYQTIEAISKERGNPAVLKIENFSPELREVKIEKKFERSTQNESGPIKTASVIFSWLLKI